MRILCIRGKNLASLADEFVVELAAPPLGGCGVFALSGPTGAGKSTILDALCLALYATTPRLERALRVQMPDPSGQTIPSDNAAHLLRRGAGSGFAEVEFTGNDGRVYRARLTLRRANGRANGKMQPLIHELFCKDDTKPCGGTASETQSLIVAKLGLDVRQFTRAVLLAQNEFAAFLASNADDRATLLETLTGTERFGELSTRVFERAKTERGRLEALDRELCATPVLDDAERIALEERIAALGRQLETAELRVTAIGNKLEHERRLRQLQDAVATAAEQVQARQRQSDALAPERRELRRLRRVMFEAKELLDAQRETESERQRLGQQAQQHAHSVEQSTTALGQLWAGEQATALALAETEGREPEVRRLMGQAALIDQELAQHHRDLDVQRHALRQTQEKHLQEQQELERARRRLVELEQQLAEQSSWFEERTPLARLADGWAEKREALGRALRRQERIVSELSRLTEQKRTLEVDRSRLSELGAEVQRLRSVMLEAEALSQSLLAAACAQDLEQLEASERQAERHLALHDELAELWGELRQYTAELDLCRRRDLEGRVAIEQRQRDVEARRHEIEQLRRLHQCKTDELRGAERLVGQTVQALRAVLHEGEPCPVCGATEHPFGGDATEAVSARLRENLATLTAQVQAMQTELARLERADAEALAEAARVEERLQSNAQTMQRLEAHLEAQRTRLDSWEELRQLGAVPADELGAALSQRRVELEAHLEATRQVRAEAKQRQVLAEQALQHARTSSADHAAADEQRQKLERLVAELERKSVVERAQLDALEIEQARDLEPLASWREQWNTDPAGCLRDVDTGVAEWQQRITHQAALVEERTQTLARIPLLESRVAEMALAESGIHEQINRVERAIAEKQQVRLGLFEGRPVDRVETELRVSLQRARTDHEQARTQRIATEQALAVAVAQRDAAVAALEAANQAFETRELTIHRWLAAVQEAEPELGLVHSELLELIDRGPTAVVDIEKRLDAAQTALHQAHGSLEQAVMARDAQQAQGIEVELVLRSVLGDLAPATLDELLVKTTSERETLRNERADELARQLHDRETRAALGKRSSERDMQRSVVERWQLLAELIGSADGKKLRHLAQEVTLDLVLEHANQHLHDLARRYRLERLPQGLHIVVVDAELFGEARSVASLSGGETFLVSLALALGLASLSAEKVRVETLFIDEGFGSLDHATLQIAVAALDRVQAAGRQVGVVSHVGDLAERLGVEVRVEPTGGGKSRVRILARQGSS